MWSNIYIKLLLIALFIEVIYNLKLNHKLDILKIRHK